MSLCLFVQAGTGLIFTIEQMTGSSDSREHGTADVSIFQMSVAQADGLEPETSHAKEESKSLLSIVHYGGGMIGNVYRLLLAAAIIGQVGAGCSFSCI